MKCVKIRILKPLKLTSSARHLNYVTLETNFATWNCPNIDNLATFKPFSVSKFANDNHVFF